MNRICKIVLDKCLCVDPPVLNLSSEAPDPLIFTGEVYDPFNPWRPQCLTCSTERPGTIHDCRGVVYSYTSQTAADVLARVQGVICEQGDPTQAQVFNDAQSAMAYCDDGSSFTYTVPAGYYVSPLLNAEDVVAWKAAANDAALAFAQQQASAELTCVGGGDDINGGGGGGAPTKLSNKSNWCCLGEDLATVLYSVTGANSGADWDFTVTAGALPPGTDLVKIDHNTAQLQGTPITAGKYTYSITAARTDLNWMTCSANYTFWVFGITNPTLPDATAGVAYGPEQITTAGGEGTVTFALSSGSSLPAGFSLSASGEVTSDDTIVAGDYTFTVNITDETGGVCEQECSIAIAGTCISDLGTPPTGYLTSAYNWTVVPGFGTGPYVFFAVNLPDGLLLNPATGVVSGTPTVAASFNTQITITDSLGVVSLCYATFEIQNCSACCGVPEGSVAWVKVMDNQLGVAGTHSSVFSGLHGTAHLEANNSFQGSGWEIQWTGVICLESVTNIAASATYHGQGYHVHEWTLLVSIDGIPVVYDGVPSNSTAAVYASTTNGGSVAVGPGTHTLIVYFQARSQTPAGGPTFMTLDTCNFTIT